MSDKLETLYRLRDELKEALTDSLVEKLVDDDYNTIMENDGQTWLLLSYLEHGFKGYRNYTYRELLKECKERGLNLSLIEDEGNLEI